MITIRPKISKQKYRIAKKFAQPGQPIIPPQNPYQKVPCGKCAFCLTNRRSQWMFRIHHEMRNQLNRGYFLTMTYDEKHVPRVDSGLLSLRFKHVQLYLKRIRKDGYKVKYIAVGEYGSETKRPHYHMLLWSDAPPITLEKHWNYGRIQFGTLTMASAMYTLKYIIQPKINYSDEIERPRAQFSKFIGASYITDATYEFHSGLHFDPEGFTRIDGRRVTLPRYIKSKIFTSLQNKLATEQIREEAISHKAKQFVEAVRLGHGSSKSAKFIERLRGARRYLRALRVEENNRIFKNTKFNQTL